MKFPTWNDVLLPDTFPDLIREVSGNYLDFLVYDRVFHGENKIRYSYTCIDCGHRKTISKQYEEYTSCEVCGRLTHGIPHWKITSDMDMSSFYDLATLTRQMRNNYYNYFGEKLDNVLGVRFENRFFAKFVGGDEVTGISPETSIIQASLLCPFLWDAFKWNNPNRLQLIHLFKRQGT